MNILVTGAGGFVGKNLVENLKNIRDGKNRTRPNIRIQDIYEYDITSAPEELDEYCAKADFVFNLAGVNRPKDPEEFKTGNIGFVSRLLDTLKSIAAWPPSCCPAPSRPPCRAASAPVSTAFPRKRGRICFSNMRRRPGPRCWCIASPIWWASGCGQTTIPL